MINPSTYKTLDKLGYWGVHVIGELWAEMLWVLTQELIAKHGFTINCLSHFCSPSYDLAIVC
jgi:hypothetical protein